MHNVALSLHEKWDSGSGRWSKSRWFFACDKLGEGAAMVIAARLSSSVRERERREEERVSA